MHKKPSRLFMVIVLTSVILMTYQSRSGPIRLLWFLPASFNYINALISYTGVTVSSTLENMTLQKEELAMLRMENRALRFEAQKQRELLHENQRLREALALKRREIRHVATARVISRGNYRWSNTFVVDKGRDDLVEKDMAVITPEGLVGKVVESEASFSKVLLIGDAWFSAAVRLQNRRVEAVLSGAGQGQCVLKYLGVDTEVQKGDVVATSGLDGLFPPGIDAGYVSEVHTDKKDLFHNIKVTPFVDSRNVEEVTIVRR